MGGRNSTANIQLPVTPQQDYYAVINNIPSISRLPDANTGWVATHFKEYNKEKNVVVNTYKALDRLGKGGFGTVYKVENIATNEIFALKYINTADASASVIKEANIMKTLSHPSIAKVHSFFPMYDPKTGGTISFCIIMDFIEGDNLRAFMQKVDVPIPKIIVMEWFIKLLEAIDYLHTQKVFHRDIKPENIIISTDGASLGEVILVDFGLATRQIQSQQNVTVAGTIPYLAPECFTAKDGKIALSGKADIWALGCVLYETYTKDSSFTRSSTGMLFKYTTDPRFLDKVEDISIGYVLKPMLNIDATERITSTDLLNSPALAGWKGTIDPSSPVRGVCPKTTMELLPYLSIFQDNAASNEHCLANLLYLLKFININDFAEVLVTFNFTSILLQFLETVYEKERGKAESRKLIYAASGSLLQALMCLRVASQINSYVNGIQILFQIEAYDVLVNYVHYSIGLANMRNGFGLDFLLQSLLSSSAEERYKVGMIIYEELAESNVPISLYLDALTRSVKDLPRKTRRIADFLIQHEDTEALVQNESYYIMLVELISSCIFVNNENTSRLLIGLFHTVRPTKQVRLVECNNSSVCTASATGPTKYYQYVFNCRTCGATVCLPCTRNCHAECKGDFDYGLAKCRCKDRKNKKCECSSGSQQINLVMLASNDNLLPTPWEVSSSSRFWEGIQELKTITYNPSKDQPRIIFRNKGFTFTPASLSAQTIVFYFEVEILAPPISRDSAIGIGLTNKDPAPKKGEMVGWANGWGYHSDDGKKFCSKGRGVSYGPVFSTGDKVGCGILGDGTVFFTLNGQFLGTSQNDPKVPLQATVYSSVSIVGWEAHLRFHYTSFAFSTSRFEASFTESLVSQYRNLKLLSDVFGEESHKILDFLAQYDHDIVALLLHALIVANSGKFNTLTSHSLCGALLNSKSQFASSLTKSAIELLGQSSHTFHSTDKEPKKSISSLPSSPLSSSKFSGTPTRLSGTFSAQTSLNENGTITKSSLEFNQEQMEKLVAQMVQNKLELLNTTKLASSKSNSSASLSSPSITLLVSLAHDPEDVRELVLSPSQCTMQGIKVALAEVYENISSEDIALVQKEVERNNSVALVKLVTEKSFQMLKSNDKIIFYVKK